MTFFNISVVLTLLRLLRPILSYFGDSTRSFYIPHLSCHRRLATLSPFLKTIFFQGLLICYKPLPLTLSVSRVDSKSECWCYRHGFIIKVKQSSCCLILMNCMKDLYKARVKQSKCSFSWFSVHFSF